MAEVQSVAYGRAATRALRDAIAAAQSGDRLAPVTVIVPSNLAGLAARRTLAEQGGLANVAFDTPFGLAERLGRAAAAAAGCVPLTESVLVAAIRAELADHTGFFAPVAEHAATERALARRYAELSRARPETMERLRRDGSERARALVELCDGVRRRLGDRLDEDRLVAFARAALDAGGPAVSAIGRVVVHLPQPLPPALHDLVGAVTAARPTAWVVGGTGDVAADAAVIATCAAWGVVVRPLEAAPVTGTEMIGASDVDDELRAVTRRLLALAGTGLRFDRMAVVMPAMEPYARTVSAMFDAAGIPHNGPSARRLGDSIAGRAVTRLVRMVETDFGRDEVMAFLAAVPLRTAADRPVPTDRWDRVSRRAGVVGGDDWGARLERYAIELAARADDRLAAGTGDDAGLRRTVAAARELAAFVADLRARVRAVADAVGWHARADRVAATLDALLVDARARRRWPEDEVDALDAVHEALARLADLDAIDPAPTMATFARALESELRVGTGRTGHYGDGVACVSLSAGVGLDHDVVAVVGLAEGTIPTVRREDALLADPDRALAIGGELATRASAAADQRRAYLAALMGGGTHRILSAPRGDLRTGRERAPSRFLLETATALTDRRVFGSDFASLTGPDGLDAVPSFAAGLERVDAAATAVDRELGVVGAAVAAGADAIEHPAVAGTAVAVGIEADRARAGSAVTRWDGNVGTARDAVPSPATGVPVSPTRLQDWVECPFRYFLGNVLRVPVEDTPERVLELSALDRGTLVHEILEAFVAEELAKPASERVAPGQPWGEPAMQRMRALLDAHTAAAEAKGLTGKTTLWTLRREEIEADLFRFLVEDGWYRVELGTVPDAVEVPFGLDGAPGVDVELDDGRHVTFRGRADRIDVAPDGTQVVLDYKTGSPPQYDATLCDDPVRGGHRLQLPVYAAAARQLRGATDVEAVYWYVSDAGGWQRDEFVLNDANDARFREVVGHIVDGIDAGLFPPVPGDWNWYHGTGDHCAFCDYRDLCPVDRIGQYDAKSNAPEYEPLHALVPDAGDEVDGG
jgi:RecB family exonuclease